MAESLEKKLSRLARGKFLNWKERREFKTGALKSPKDFIWLEVGKFSDYYPKDMMKKIIKTASNYGLDPYDLLAVGIAESGLGYKNPVNPMQINLDVHEDEMRKRYPQLQTLPKQEMTGHPAFPSLSIDYAGHLLDKALKEFPEDRLSGLQAYSGKGRVLYGGTVKDEKYFNKPSKEINFWRDKPQGKRVDRISTMIKLNEELQHLIRRFWQEQDFVNI